MATVWNLFWPLASAWDEVMPILSRHLSEPSEHGKHVEHLSRETRVVLLSNFVVVIKLRTLFLISSYVKAESLNQADSKYIVPFCRNNNLD
jgi:hypothetical protein